MVSVEEAFTIQRSLPHGHVSVIVGMIKKLGFDTLISSTPSPEQNLVLAMIAERLLKPCSKFATTRFWHTTSLATELNVSEADEDDLYRAMDWLVSRQSRIEKKLAKRHLNEGSFAFYDVTSSTYEGQTCSLARLGHNRDRKR